MTFEEYNRLKEKIDYHMDRYYNLDEPEISDYEYDQLMIALKEA
jgi:DNA ligase (NAD+)